MKRTNYNQREFYVVQFVELPFEGIDNYVCVPNTWITSYTADKANVAYPIDEDRFDTKNRVKRKERYHDEWQFYMATIKYASNSYLDAETWIAMTYFGRPLVTKESKVTDKQRNLSMKNKLLTANQRHAAKSTKSSCKTSCDYMRPEQTLSPVSKDVRQNSEFIDNNDEDHSQRDTRTKQANFSSNTTNVSMTTTRLSTAAIQRTELNLYNYQKYIPDSSLLTHFQQQIQNIRTLGNINSQKKKCRPLLSVQNPVKNWLLFIKMERNLAIGNQIRDLLTPLVLQPPIFSQIQFQNDSQVLKKQTKNNRDQTASLGSIGISSQEIREPEINFETCIDSTAVDPRNVLQTIDNDKATSQENQNLPVIGQNLTLLSNPMYRTSKLTQQRQVQPNQLDSQQHTLRPKPRIGNSVNRKNRKPKLNLQSVTKNILSHILTVLNSVQQPLLSFYNKSLPQTQATMSSLSTINNNVASETSDRQNTQMLNRPNYNKSSRIKHTITRANGYQKLCTQKQLTYQSTPKKRDHFMDYFARPLVTDTDLNVVEKASQTDQYMVDKNLSPLISIDLTLDSDTATDHGIISNHEMSADEAPLEISKNVYITINVSSDDSTDGCP